MKKLILVRHAKSSWDDPDLNDFKRPLNKRGQKDAPRMAQRLKERNIHPDIMITSPATRALATCEAMADGLGFARKKIITDTTLYHASEEQILSSLQHLPDYNDQEEVALLFGHNPGLTEFANKLLHERIDNIPTCGIVGCTLAATSWKDVTWGNGKLEFFDFPKKK